MLKAKQTDRAALPAGPTSLRRRPIVRLPVAMLLAAAASACTLSDSLVPPNPIPEARPSEAAGYGQDATPIDPSTGDDRVAMAAPAPTGPVEAAALPPPAATTSRSGGVYAPRTAPGSGSSNRQAAAFPAASQKRRTPPPARASEPQPAPAAAPAAPAAAATTTASREPARQTAPTIRFTPVIGAPVGAIRPLSAELEKAARSHGVVIRNTADEPVDNILRGYFSASAGGSKVRLVYMWDVLDASGTQLHRMQGTVTAPGSAADPWKSVPDATMRDIARKTISDYLAWRAGRPG